MARGSLAQCSGNAGEGEAKARAPFWGRLAVGALVGALAGAGAPTAARDVALEHGLNEQVVRVPARVGEQQWSLVATTYHPAGEGPFPLIVLNHGSPGSADERAIMGRYRHIPQIREFINRGFAVIVPMRRGYGDTGGEWAERFGACRAPDYYRAGQESAKDVIAAVEYAQGLPFVKRDRVILVGQSAGGIASIAAASANPPGVVAVVNFAGGRGGRPYTHPGEPCVASAMTEAIGKFARTVRVPVLWHYAENDQFFAPHHVKAWFKAFEEAGAKGVLVMQPPFQWDGHGIFGAAGGLPIWTAAFDRFLKEIQGSGTTVPPATAPGLNRVVTPPRPPTAPSAATDVRS